MTTDNESDPDKTARWNPPLEEQQQPEQASIPDPEMSTLIRPDSHDTWATLPATASQSSAGGGTIGDYEILHEIARGGMGVVYKARHRTLGRLAAIKLIKSGELAESEEVQRFQVEAQAAAVLDHPGIVPVFEVGQQGPQHFLAMAFIDGQSLSQRVKESPLPPKEAARIMQHVAEAVQYAHDHGIVHRDLKPQNILLTKDGQPKVTDFGLAKKQGGDSSLTATGQILGTPSYMPPEQTKGTSDQIGPLADVYSLGATLYCLLTGRPPFQSSTPLETMLQVANQEPVSPRQLIPTIPRDLETICLKCLQKNPAQRYVSAGALADDLHHYLADEPILARPVGRMEKVWRWCRRNPVGTALAGSFVVLLCFAALTAWLVRDQQRSRQVAQIAGSFESLLDRPAADPSFIDQGESLLAALAVFAPARIEEDETRLWQSYAKAVEAGVLQPKLSPEDEQQLTAALTRLSERDATEAGRLQKLLDGRRRSWQPIAELSAPYANSDAVFDTDYVEIKDGSLHRRNPPGDPETSNIVDLWANILAPGKARFEATFAADSEAAGRLGIEFHYVDVGRYLFLVTAEMPPMAEPLEDAASVPTFAAARRAKGQLKIQILRNTVPLRSQTVSLATLPAGPLRLDARRDGDRLEFRVSDAEPLVFEDIFAIRSPKPARMGLLWPQGERLVSLHAYSMPAKESVNPLEAGDVLFAAGEFDAALSEYRESATVTADESLRREARYKQGVCLQELRQPDDAAAMFESLIGEDGPRWPMLAAIQLWVIQVRTQQREAADTTFDAIAGRYSFEELATLIPENLRGELIGLYQPKNISRVLQILSYDPQRVRTLERYVQMLDLFNDQPFERMAARVELIDALWASGRQDLAYRMLDDICDRTAQLALAQKRIFSYSFPLYLAKEFKLKRAENLLGLLNEALSPPINNTQEIQSLWKWKAQCEAQLGDWELAENSLQQGAAIPKDGMYADDWNVTAKLLQGFVREKLGDHDGAQAAWREGTQITFSGHKTFLHYLVLLGLTRQMTPADAEIFLTRLTDSASGSIGAAARGFVSAELLSSVVNEMFQSPHGRENAWQVASGELFPSEQSEKIASLLAYEFIRQGGFEGEFSAEQNELMWSTCQEALRQMAHEGKFSALQAGQFALAWRGVLNVLGWGGLAPSLPPEFRGPAAYALAHRMLRRAQPTEAAKLFSETLMYAELDSPLAKLAQQDSELLQADQGLLIVRKSGTEPVTLEILAGEEVIRRIETQTETEVALPVGDYSWRIADGDVRGRVSLSLCGRRFIELPEVP